MDDVGQDPSASVYTLGQLCDLFHSGIGPPACVVCSAARLAVLVERQYSYEVAERPRTAYESTLKRITVSWGCEDLMTWSITACGEVGESPHGTVYTLSESHLDMLLPGKVERSQDVSSTSSRGRLFALLNLLSSTVMNSSTLASRQRAVELVSSPIKGGDVVVLEVG